MSKLDTEYRCVIVKQTKPRVLRSKTWTVKLPKILMIENFSGPIKRKP